MRPKSIQEIDLIVESLSLYQDKPLQSIACSDQDVVLGFWEGRRALWLWMDLSQAAPVLLPMMELPLTPVSKKSPLHLFLRAHFQGAELVSVERDVEMGRVVRLVFSNESSLEFRMIPRGVNLIARAAGKKVSMKPVKELPAPHEVPLGEVRSLGEMFEEWKLSRLSPKSKRSPKAALEKKLEGARRSLDKVSAEIQVKTESPWRALGDWLVQHQSLDVPEEFASLVDRRRKLSWNIEQCFQKAKESGRKLTGTRDRLVEIKAEIVELERRLVDGEWLVGGERKSLVKNPKKISTSSRTLHLGENLQVIAGKSAADNMKLLRQAHAWDLWLHVKDQPSAHAILFRPRGFKVSDDLLRTSAQWLLKMSLGQKFKEFVGVRFDVLCTECRFVSAIKGDRLGRVNYREERVFGVRFEG